MEHNQFAVFEQTSDSDHSSFGDNSTVPISQSDQVIPERGLSDPAKFTYCIFRKGVRYSARGGGTSAEGTQYREPKTSHPQTSQKQTTASVVVSEVRGAKALPEPPATRTETFGEYEYLSSSPVQGTDLEWDHPLPSDKPFTPMQIWPGD